MCDAVLSHSLPEQADDFTATQFDVFDQAHDHPHVRQHRRAGQTRLVEHHPCQSQLDRHRQCVAGGLVGRRPLQIEIGLRRRGRRNLLAVAAGIQPLLLRFPGRRLIARRTPLAAALPAMVLPAAERTTQVPPTCISGVSKKANPAVRAVRPAAAKLGMGLQDRVQRGLILPDKRPGAIVLVPIRAKREKLLDGYGKKARPSVIISIVLCTPSSYLVDAKASRGRARFSMRDGEGFAQTVGTNDPTPIAHPASFPCQVNAGSLRITSERLLGKKEASSFQVAAQFT